jgi:pullulanase/glycogen debranching enzyme
MSSDEVNNVDWSVLKEGSAEYEMMLYYKGLIEMRKTFGIFSDNASNIQYTQLGSGVVAVTFDDGNGGKALFVMNPNKTALPYALDGEWLELLSGERYSGKVAPQSAVVLRRQ